MHSAFVASEGVPVVEDGRFGRRGRRLARARWQLLGHQVSVLCLVHCATKLAIQLPRSEHHHPFDDNTASRVVSGGSQSVVRFVLYRPSQVFRCDAL